MARGAEDWAGVGGQQKNRGARHGGCGRENSLSLVRKERRPFEDDGLGERGGIKQIYS